MTTAPPPRIALICGTSWWPSTFPVRAIRHALPFHRRTVTFRADSDVVVPIPRAQPFVLEVKSRSMTPPLKEAGMVVRTRRVPFHRQRVTGLLSYCVR